jgi:dTDP-4-amino-4,6-dideoxygalactose transaminase
MYRIPLIKPHVTDTLKKRVCDVLDTGYLTEGPITREFEQAIAKQASAKHCLAVTSCTTGLELALRALGVGPDHEVIIPDYTYPATASVVNIVGANIVIVDVDPETMLIDYDALEKAITPKTKAAIPVSLFGNPLDWDKLNSIKNKHDIFMLEDAACSLGSSYKGTRTGSLADISVFSHHPRKFITTGEGGTVTTNNTDWADWMHSYKHFGMGVSDSRLTSEFVRIGTNYKLSNVLAAIGLAQMDEIDELLAERRQLADHYLSLLSGFEKITLPRTTDGAMHSWQTFCVFVENRDQIMADMRENGIEAQIGTYSLHMHPAFNDNVNCHINNDMTGSRYAFEHALALPLFHGMTKNEQREVAETLKKIAG